MPHDIATGLKTLGLSKNEANIYTASLKMGPATAQHLAAKATISRPTTYVMVESLMKRGLLTSYFKGKKKFFAPANPLKLRHIVQELKREAAEKEIAVEGIVEALGKMVSDEQSAATVRVLEGADIADEVRRDISASGADQVLEIIGDGHGEHSEIAVHPSSKYRLRSLHGSAAAPRQKPTKGVETRRVDSKAHPIVGSVIVYGDRVLLASATTKKLAMLLRDQSIAETLRTMYAALWENAKKA